jgi:hypothetical protein
MLINFWLIIGAAISNVNGWKAEGSSYELDGGIR